MSPALKKKQDGSTHEEQQCLENAAAQDRDEGQRPDINNLPDHYFQQEEVVDIVAAEDNERDQVAELPQVQIEQEPVYMWRQAL